MEGKLKPYFKCPKCKNKKWLFLYFLEGQETDKNAPTFDAEMWKCMKCGHSEIVCDYLPQY